MKGFFYICFLLLAATILRSQEISEEPDANDVPVETEETEEILPTGFPVTRYSSIWENSPFNREVIKPTVTKLSSTFGKTLVLEGLVNDASVGPIAYIKDTKENKSFSLTSTKGSGDYPFNIVSANKDPDPMKTTVVITDGNEEAEIGYSANLLTKAIQQSPRQSPQKPSGGTNAAAKARQAALRNQKPQGGTPPPGGTGRQVSSISGNQSPTNPTPENDAIDRLDEEPRRRSVPLPKAK